MLMLELRLMYWTGSFKNPQPGSPVSVVPAEGHATGQKVSDLEDSVARENFRVVIIKPTVVEQLDLSDPDKARRYRFTFVGDSTQETDDGGEVIGEWRREELWP